MDKFGANLTLLQFKYATYKFLDAFAHFRKILRLCLSRYLVSSILALVAVVLILFSIERLIHIPKLFIQILTAYIVSYIFFFFTEINQGIKFLPLMKGNIQALLNHHKKTIHYLLGTNLTVDALRQLETEDFLYKKLETLDSNRLVNYAIPSSKPDLPGGYGRVSALDAVKIHVKKVKDEITDLLQYNLPLPPELQKIFFDIKNSNLFYFIYMFDANHVSLKKDDSNHRRTLSENFVKYHAEMKELAAFFKNYIDKNFSFISPNYPQGKPGYRHCLLSCKQKPTIGGNNSGIYLYCNNDGEVCAIIKHNQSKTNHLNLSRLFDSKKQKRLLSKLKFPIANTFQDTKLNKHLEMLILDYCTHNA